MPIRPVCVSQDAVGTGTSPNQIISFHLSDLCESGQLRSRHTPVRFGLHPATLSDKSDSGRIHDLSDRSESGPFRPVRVRLAQYTSQTSPSQARSEKLEDLSQPTRIREPSRPVRVRPYPCKAQASPSQAGSMPLSPSQAGCTRLTHQSGQILTTFTPVRVRRDPCTSQTSPSQAGPSHLSGKSESGRIDDEPV